jgi:Sigma-70, region 4.
VDAEERNLERIGQRFGVTRERLRRIVRQLTADLELRRRLAAAADIALPDGE